MKAKAIIVCWSFNGSKHETVVDSPFMEQMTQEEIDELIADRVQEDFTTLYKPHLVKIIPT